MIVQFLCSEGEIPWISEQAADMIEEKQEEMKWHLQEAQLVEVQLAGRMCVKAVLELLR